MLELVIRYLKKRLLEIIPTTFGILLLTFILFHVAGGSPAQVVLGKNATATALAAFDAKFGYDKPLFLNNWARLRALPDAIAPTLATNNWQVPLAYNLPAGTYRLKFKSDSPQKPDLIVLTLLNLTDGDISKSSEIKLRTSGRYTIADFEIEDGWLGKSVAGITNPPQQIWLRRKTAHLFDSQFFHFFGNLLKGDLGESSEFGRPVAHVLREGVGPSLSLTIPILLGGTLLSLMLAVMCAVWRDRSADRLILTVSTILMSVNYVVWVLAGQYFLAFRLRLFPIWGFESITFLLLPVIIGIIGGLGRDVRFFRSIILDEISRPYVRTAISKGLTPAQIMTRHVLRNSLIPILTYVSLSIPFLFTGSLLLESFFGIPGLGSVSLNAIHSSDMAIVRAVVVIGALLYQGVNLLTDLSYAWLDPRVRLE